MQEMRIVGNANGRRVRNAARHRCVKVRIFDGNRTLQTTKGRFFVLERYYFNGASQRAGKRIGHLYAGFRMVLKRQSRKTGFPALLAFAKVLEMLR